MKSQYLGVAIGEKAFTAKIKCYFETEDIILMWPLGRILKVKPDKRDGLVRRVRLKTKSVVLKCPIDKIVFRSRGS